MGLLHKKVHGFFLCKKIREKRNPNLELIGAYIHSDEATIHAHLDYIPVATGYKKGLVIQNGLVKALDQQGFIKHGKETASLVENLLKNLRRFLQKMKL